MDLDLTPICIQEASYEVERLEKIVKSFYGRKRDYHTYNDIVHALLPYCQSFTFTSDYSGWKLSIMPRGVLEGRTLDMFL